MTPTVITIYCLGLQLAVLAHAQNGTTGFLMTPTSYNTTKAALQAHVSHIASLPDLRTGAIPQFFLHPPGTRVQGTIVIFHGFTSLAGASVQQARYLHSRGFNTVAFNLAGFAQEPSHWQTTVLRDTFGSADVRAHLKNDPELSRLFASLATANTAQQQFLLLAALREPVMPKVNRLLSGKRFLHARRALQLLSPASALNNGISKALRQAYYSSHKQYDASLLAQLQLVQALPGPTHAIGYSFGGPNTVRLAALSQVLDKIVLLAPFFGKYTDDIRADISQVFSVMGALELLDEPSSGGPPPVNSFTAATIVATSARRDDITMRVRKQTSTLCIIAGDDTTIDVTDAVEICNSKLGGSVFVYPPSFGINHAITPEAGNQYSDAMMEQVASYFLNGNIDQASFLVKNKPALVK